MPLVYLPISLWLYSNGCTRYSIIIIFVMVDVLIGFICLEVCLEAPDGNIDVFSKENITIMLSSATTPVHNYSSDSRVAQVTSIKWK
jgi:hypothetical protein